MPVPPPSIAATSTLAMVLTAEARGFETADLLDAVGLSRDRLDDPDMRLPGPTVLAVWAALRERTGDPALQLVAPLSLPFGAYRVVDFMVASSATVAEGIGRFARFFRLIADAVALTIEGGEEGRCLCMRMGDGGPVPPVYVDYVFAALVGRIRLRIRPELEVLRVELRQPEPTAAAVYADVFRAPVRFGQAADRLCFSTREWDSTLATAEPVLAGLLEEHARLLAQRIPDTTPHFRVEVQQAIAAALPDGGSAATVARTLHVSVRTLQRRLVATGTTFRDLADTVRARLAEEYLTDRGVSTAEVAFLLGFSDQTSFNRAFRRWTGESPGRWRRLRG